MMIDWERPMLERVARAIADYWLEHGYDPSEPDEGVARAALGALREPSDQMIDAVYKNEFIQAMRPEDLYAAWESMIDAALGEKP